MTLPDCWTTQTLQEIGERLGGGTPSRRNPEYFKGEIPWLTVADLPAIGSTPPVIQKSREYITNDAIRESSAKRIPKGSVLFATRVSVGKTAIAGIDVSTNQDFRSLLPNSGFDSRYLAHYLSFVARFRPPEDRGSTINGITAGTFDNIKVPLPPTVDGQTRIAEKLDAIATRIDDICARLDVIPSVIKRFRRSVLAAACSGRLTERWRKEYNADTASALLTRIKAARLATASREAERNKITEFFLSFPEEEGDGIAMPTSWLQCFVGSVGNVCNGSTPSRKELSYWGGNIPWVSSGEVQNCHIHQTREGITEAGYDNSSVRLLPKGTVLLAMIGEGKTRGQTAILEIEACINQNMAAIVLDHGLIEPKYLWYWFQSQYQSNREAGSGSGPQALNCQRVRELPLNLPPLEEQVEIVRRIDKMFEQADAINARYSKARAFADKLMPSVLARAFRGDLFPEALEPGG
jgi:type I restriction enzyme, S subunit